jgi:uncharacterized protein YjiS (DUF1127 family)
MMTLSLIAAMMRRLRTTASTALVAIKHARHRRALANLAMLDDRMLRDVGLERSDVYEAMALPFGQDAGLFLDERRGGRPARAARLADEIAAIRFSASANETEAARLAA